MLYCARLGRGNQMTQHRQEEAIHAREGEMVQ